MTSSVALAMAMGAETLPNYVPAQAHDATHGASNGRARLVCVRCHNKKIRCDIRRVDHEGYEIIQPCKHCERAGSECLIRSSRRGTAKRKARCPRGVPSHPNDGNPEVVVHATCTSIAEPDETLQTFNSNLIFSPPQPLPNGVTYHNDSLLSRRTYPEQDQNEYGASDPGNLGSKDKSPSARLEKSAVPPGRELDSPQQHHPPSYIGDSGYMPIFSHEIESRVAPSPKQQQVTGIPNAVDFIRPALKQSYLDTYFEYVAVWCPVMHRETLQTQPDVLRSSLFTYALALSGNQINPPLVDHTDSATLYHRAKSLFYEKYEENPIIRISSLMLFYWWSAGAPNVVSMDNNWWWTGIAIRLAQEIGLHREPQPGQIMRHGETPGLRRRIWWTLFARERITAISQGRPCIIDMDYCDVEMVTVEDFPCPADLNAHIFVSWVHLCKIVGEMGKLLCQKAGGPRSTMSVGKQLVDWVQSLPNSLQLPISYDRTSDFNRDVHGMHLTYLTHITLLYLSKSAQSLPKASTTAIIAASCVARIFEDYLVRGTLRFLSGQAGWYITIAILGLLHARRVQILATHADNDIRTLRTALKQLGKLWPSAHMFDLGCETLLSSEHNHNGMSHNAAPNGDSGRFAAASTLADLATGDGFEWMGYFPYVTVHTTPLIGAILVDDMANSFSDLEWTVDVPTQLQELCMLPEDFNSDSFNILSMPTRI
ncbi:uncharacterized protein BP5553_09778 [Venustampulla echinocandica]|uniref:Zn(2)-C6 fungal-type domain-containing protein n=1 Tax=Venustampulla echinocandica TaxID=2656787 RepID=A0A370TAP3_9HELO|nr:uncharacterized protein BP5553_09778 [Venustampulla echinocandica]RDL30989.1 hypothetical protein BP5553_09778 [Venustampulla echinocandica]